MSGHRNLFSMVYTGKEDLVNIDGCPQEMKQSRNHNLLDVLRKGKWVILLSIVVSTLVAFSFSFLPKKPVVVIYESQATYKIGEMTVLKAGRFAFAEPDAVLQGLLAKYGQNMGTPYIAGKVLADNRISLVAYGESPEAAQKFLQDIVAELKAHDDRIINEILANKNELVMSLNKTNQLAKNVLAAQESQAGSQKYFNPMTAALIFMLADVQDRIYMAELERSEFFLRRSEVVKAPTLPRPQAPRGPSLQTLIILGASAGFAIGVIGVLIRGAARKQF